MEFSVRMQFVFLLNIWILDVDRNDCKCACINGNRCPDQNVMRANGVDENEQRPNRFKSTWRCIKNWELNFRNKIEVLEKWWTV